MSRKINNQYYYSVIEVCREVGISKSTLLRWLKEEPYGNAILRDRRGWRLFSETDLRLIKNEAHQTNISNEDNKRPVTGNTENNCTLC